MSISFAEATRTWAKIGLCSFGGPAAQIATMHRILVDEKGWVEESRFLHALNYCMLLPGPEAMQLAIYLGWLLKGGWGGLVAGLLFIVPGILVLMILSLIYAVVGQVGLVGAAFFGLKAAVIAIVLHAVKRLAAKSLKAPVLQTIAAVSFIAIFVFNLPFPLIILAAGLVGYLRAERSHQPEPDISVHPGWQRGTKIILFWGSLWLGPVVVLLVTLGPDNIYSHLAVFFSKMAVVTFGGAYAVLAYVAQEVVLHNHWLTQAEMLDGLGMAETTPGPLIMVLQFVGFMAAYRDPGSLSPIMAGLAGGLLTTWVTFTPCFLWIFLGAPYVEQLRHNQALSGILKGISAAVVGVIFNLGLWFALQTLFAQHQSSSSLGGVIRMDIPVWSSLNVWSLVLSIAALVALFRYNANMLTTLLGCAAVGIGLHLTF